MSDLLRSSSYGDAGVDALLADGRVAVVRGLRAADRDLLRALHEGLSEENRRRRFFAVGTLAGVQYADHLCSGDPGVVAEVACLDDRLIGVASAERSGPDVAEIALVVADDVHGLGVGTLLLEHLSAACRERGITRLTADVLVDNPAMMRVLLDAGSDLSRTLRSGVVHVEMSTAATARAVEAADARDGRAEARSLAPLLAPHSVVVVGVRRDGTGAGAAVVEAIRSGGFSGDLALVHPTATEIDGVPAYPSVTQVPGQIDLVVITVPAAHVEDVVEQSGVAGAGAAVIVSAGFGELGEEGAQVQRRILRSARRHSVRLVGPNCLGLLTTTPDGRLDATFGRFVPPHGGLALASQSGGVGIVVLDRAGRIGVGVRAFVSLGNKLDVSGNDLLAAWYDDPGVTMAGLYLESFGNPRRFLRLARRFSARKPLLAVRAARTASGRRAGAAHTAGVGASAAGIEALFAQAGVIACDEAEELAQTALVLDQQPLPAGRRLGILTNAAGPAVLAADAAEQHGLRVPQLSPALASRLATLVPDVAAGNPVDVGPGPTAAEFAGAREALVASGEIDMLLVVLVDTRVTQSDHLLETLERREGETLPTVLVPLGGIEVPAGLATVLPTVAAAVGALARITEYAAWRHPAPETLPHAPDAARAFAVRALADTLMADRPLGPAGDRIDDAERDAVLAPYGLVPQRVGAADPDLGVDLALRLVGDPALGPLVTVNYAGVEGELWRDPVVLVPPVDAHDVETTLRRLRTWPLLDGVSGALPPAVGALGALVTALSDIAIEVPQVAGLDLEPVRLTPTAAIVGDARLRLAPGGPRDDGSRHLSG